MDDIARGLQVRWLSLFHPYVAFLDHNEDVMDEQDSKRTVRYKTLLTWTAAAVLCMAGAEDGPDYTIGSRVWLSFGVSSTLMAIRSGWTYLCLFADE